MAGSVCQDCDGALAVCPAKRLQLCPLASLGLRHLTVPAAREAGKLGSEGDDSSYKLGQDPGSWGPCPELKLGLSCHGAPPFESVYWAPHAPPRLLLWRDWPRPACCSRAAARHPFGLPCQHLGSFPSACMLFHSWFHGCLVSIIHEVTRSVTSLGRTALTTLYAVALSHITRGDSNPGIVFWRACPL